MGELTTTNQNLTKKEALGSYVHDMVDMEIRAFSLKKNMKDCRKEADEAEKKAKRDLEKARRGKEGAEKIAKEKPKLEIGNGFGMKLWACFWLVYAGGGALFLILLKIGALQNFFDSIPKNIIPVFFVSILILGIFLMFFIAHRWNSSDKKDVQKKNDEAWKQATQAYIETEKKTGEAMIYVQKLRFHANDLERDLAELHQNLQKNYALNIIPPDYRRLECLLWIDYAFRNDQVDTMREATLECDKHVMHGETMTALQELAASIRSVAVLLENMNNRISAMNANLFQIAQTQDSLLSETESARYAMESVSRSNEKLAYYEDLKRQGAFYL